jgi:hypothetical protein
VPVDKQDAVAAYQIVGNLARKSAGRWLSALLDSDDIRVRAAGLFLEGKISDGATVEPTSELARDELVQLAMGAGDPAVYAMAIWACGTYSSGAVGGAGGACQRLSAEQWARMDADNAAPWLLLATRARARRDVRAEADAFTHAAQARRTDAYSDSLFAIAEPAMPPDVTALEHWYFAIGVIGIESAMSLPYNILSKHCSTDALEDSAVRSQCNALAELLVSRGTTLLDFAVGEHLGARVGWPAKRVAELDRHRKALSQAVSLSTPAGNDDMWTCRGVELGNAFMHQRILLGEAGAAAEALERSGETDEQLARQWDEWMKRMMPASP